MSFLKHDPTETCYLMRRIKVEHVLDTGSLPKTSKYLEPCEEAFGTLKDLPKVHNYRTQINLMSSRWTQVFSENGHVVDDFRWSFFSPRQSRIFWKRVWNTEHLDLDTLDTSEFWIVDEFERFGHKTTMKWISYHLYVNIFYISYILHWS